MGWFMCVKTEDRLEKMPMSSWEGKENLVIRCF